MHLRPLVRETLERAVAVLEGELQLGTASLPLHNKLHNAEINQSL